MATAPPTTAAPTTTTTTIALIEVAETATISGSSLPQFGETPDTAVGLTAPSVAGTSFDGSEVRLEPTGKYTVIMFLAHWCPHCQEEVKDLGPYFETTPPPDNVEVVTVSSSVREAADNYPPSEWLAPGAWDLPVLVDTVDNQIGTAYGLSAFPFWVVLDPDGVVLGRTAGSLPLETVQGLFNDLAAREG